MEITASSALATVAATLATAGVVAVAPVAPVAVPDVQVPDIALSATLADAIQNAQLDFFDLVRDGQLGLNQALVHGQISFQELIFGTDVAFNGVINRSTNAFNMGLDAFNQAAQGLIGGHSDVTDGASTLTSSALIGANPLGALGPNVFNGGQIGGLTGVFDQNLQALANIIGIPGDSAMQSLQDSQIDFFQNLVNGEIAFNSSLVDSQISLQELIFGTDSALNGVINRSYNVFNMGLDTLEQTFNGALGAHGDVTNGVSDITSSLIVGLNPDIVFNGGDIGGLTGMFDQAYMVVANTFGLIGGWFGL